MTAEGTGTVVLLNYHEVTADPRVLKQARALTKRGYKVHVFCNQAAGRPEDEVFEGIRIRRFACFSGQSIDLSDATMFSFLQASRSALLERFMPYASSCRAHRIFMEYLESRLGSAFAERLNREVHGSKLGAGLLRRKADRAIANLVVSGSGFSQIYGRRNSGAVGKGRMSFRAAEKNVRETRKRLFQASSLVFASNLLRQPLPHDVCLVHAHDLYCLPGGVLVSQKLGVPLVYDAHEYEPARATKMDVNGPNLPELLEQDCFPFVSRIVTVSESIADLYRKRFPGPAPVVVMNSPETSRAELDSASPDLVEAVCIRRNAGLADDCPLVVFTGGVQRGHRGMDIVVEALTRLPDVSLVCLGPRHAGNDAWLMEHATKLGVSDRVKLLPSVDARHVPLAIRSADVAICPIQDVSLSYRFSMPNKLFEAVFARVPICVSDLPDMRRFVEDLGVGISMDQTDAASIAQAITHVLNNREQFRLTPEAEDRLNQVYSWSAQVQKLHTLYEDILADPSQARPPVAAPSADSGASVHTAVNAG